MRWVSVHIPAYVGLFLLAACGALSGAAPPLTRGDVAMTPDLPGVVNPCGRWTRAEQHQALVDLTPIPAKSPAWKIVTEWEAWRKNAGCPPPT